ncbi:uncharacterized protein LOC129596697 [Paramacrobiotus metropolitanus]|uniref:uncharacterized protein LOC129596697 n=1 Tax=Paramacrobiotus metropolitanus TaxID=2943436 RepID=UPI0024464896|nr:uncharacterized protein LOC129596697 [Paramacrobiotus metropolitanus]
MKQKCYVILGFIATRMLCSAVTVPQFDLTIIAGSSGKFVVKAVIEKIFNVFGDDKGLLRRMACTSANMPADMAVPSGGLWKVPAATFERTKHTDHYPNLTHYHQLIESNFGFEWADQEWNDLDVPLKSGLAARLALTFGEADHQNIPDNLIDQANYLTRYFDSSTTDQEKLYNMHDCIRPYQCIGRAAVCFTMDKPQNTGEDDRQRYRNFAQNLLDAIGNEVQSDVAVYSAGVHSIALLDDSDAESQSSHMQDGEHAINAVNKCVSALKQYKPQKTGVPQVILLLTDKAADAGNVRKDIVHSAGFGPEEITVFVVAVGFPYKSDDLLHITEHRENRIFTLITTTIWRSEFRRLANRCAPYRRICMSAKASRTLCKRTKAAFTG